MAASGTSTTDSKRHDVFVNSSVRDKGVNALPGIGPVAAGELERAGFKNASQVVGQFLVLEGNGDAFEDWLKSKCQARSDCRHKCYKAIKEWTEQHI
jgi:hypothetical protein